MNGEASATKRNTVAMIVSHSSPWNVDGLRLDRGEKTGDDGFFIVETILAARKASDGVRLLTRWQGYHPIDDTWEPRSNFELGDNASKSFNCTLPQTKRQATRKVSCLMETVKELERRLHNIQQRKNGSSTMHQVERCSTAPNLSLCYTSKSEDVHYRNSNQHETQEHEPGNNNLQEKSGLSAFSAPPPPRRNSSVSLRRQLLFRCMISLPYALPLSPLNLIKQSSCRLVKFPFPLARRTCCQILPPEHTVSGESISYTHLKPKDVCYEVIPVNKADFLQLLHATCWKTLTPPPSIVLNNDVPSLRFEHVETECFRLLGLPPHPLDAWVNQHRKMLPFSAVHDDPGIVQRLWLPPVNGKISDGLLPCNVASSAIGCLVPKRVCAVLIKTGEAVQHTPAGSQKASTSRSEPTRPETLPRSNAVLKNSTLYYEVEWNPTVDGDTRPNSVLQKQLIDNAYPNLFSRYRMLEYLNQILDAMPLSFILALPSCLVKGQGDSFSQCQKKSRLYAHLSNAVAMGDAQFLDGWTPQCVVQELCEESERTTKSSRSFLDGLAIPSGVQCTVSHSNNCSTSDWISGNLRPVLDYLRLLFQTLLFHLHNVLGSPQTSLTAFVYLPPPLRQAMGSPWEILGLLSTALGPRFSLRRSDVDCMNNEVYSVTPKHCNRVRRLLQHIAFPNFDEFGRLDKSQMTAAPWTLCQEHKRLFRLFPDAPDNDATFRLASFPLVQNSPPALEQHSTDVNDAAFVRVGGRYPLGLHGEPPLLVALIVRLCREIASATFLQMEKVSKDVLSPLNAHSTNISDDKPKEPFAAGDAAARGLFQTKASDTQLDKRISVCSHPIYLAQDCLKTVLRYEQQDHTERRCAANAPYSSSYYSKLHDALCHFAQRSSFPLRDSFLRDILEKSATAIQSESTLPNTVPGFSSWDILTEGGVSAAYRLNKLHDDLIHVANLSFGRPLPVDHPVPAHISPLNQLRQKPRNHPEKTRSVRMRFLKERFTSMGLASHLVENWETFEDIPKSLLADRRALWLCQQTANDLQSQKL